MSPESAALLSSSPGPIADSPHQVPSARPLRIADVTLFYGERSGGIRTYLDAKADFAKRTGAFEHHLVVPGRATGQDWPEAAQRHEQRSLRVAASNGYRVPLGGGGLQATLRALEPNVVLLHDPYWTTPRLTSRAAHEVGATVIAVHHSSAALHAAGLPGPHQGDTLRERARQLGLSARVIFSPYIHDRHALADAYAGARCVVLPGAHETFGLAALEAAACGAAVVTAESTPSATLLDGFVDTFRAGDASDLLRAIERSRTREPSHQAARALTARHGWDAALSAELADLTRLMARA